MEQAKLKRAQPLGGNFNVFSFHAVESRDTVNLESPH